MFRSDIVCVKSDKPPSSRRAKNPTRRIPVA
jgi:hypothetical protein